MAEKRTIERLWRDAAAAGRTTPAYLIQDGDDWNPLSWAEAAERVESYANGLLALGVRKGDAFAILGSSRVEWALFDFALGSIGAIGAAIYANSSPEGRRLHPRALGVGRRPLRGRDAAREGRVSTRRGAAASARAHLRRPRRPRRARARPRGRAPERAARGRRADRGGRPLHLHLHLRHDRPAQGLHDLAPQLLRDGRGRRRPAELHRARGRDAPLPPARPQLRPADAPLRRLRRLRDRVPARPAPGRRSAAGGEADGLPERAARLREGAHRRRRQVRRRDGREAEADRLGARRRPARQRAPPRR